MSGPSPHLSWDELACKDAARTPYPIRWSLTRAVTLATEFERIRATIARPIRIASGYRTPFHNKAVGGSRNSQHVQGRALDLIPPPGWTAAEFYELIRRVAHGPASLINGLGLYPTFVHIDVRPPRADGRLTVWHGSRAWAEVKRA